MEIEQVDFLPELKFKTSRSGGSGGQNVNKVSTKVELNFDVLNSSILDAQQKIKVLKKLEKRITKEGILQVIVQTERTQLGNKRIAIEKFHELIAKSFVEKKKRKATKPGKAAKEKRLKEKKIQGEKKKYRKLDV
ncbi:MAG: aminoacyl-tRNA hydrolase [Bacteroidetes bacterium]|nr:aminoacyl-tRNA hydrolase [Bacteroidota bacterium]HET6245214.1 alternative ribosome rescue aminoacyl-tRNA hydrolase ArfB [Bacteroidia bacterium]